MRLPMQFVPFASARREDRQRTELRALRKRLERAERVVEAARRAGHCQCCQATIDIVLEEYDEARFEHGLLRVYHG